MVLSKKQISLCNYIPLDLLRNAFPQFDSLIVSNLIVLSCCNNKAMSALAHITEFHDYLRPSSFQCPLCGTVITLVCVCNT